MGQENDHAVYGRLLESVHFSGYSMERACREFEFLLEDDRWKNVGSGFEDINQFLESVDLGDFKMVAHRRKTIAKKLDALAAKQTSIAKTIGVDNSTISKDLKVEKSTKREPSDNKSLHSKDIKSVDVENVEKSITQSFSISPEDVTKHADKQAQKENKSTENGDEWYTPEWLFRSLGLMFAIDVCAPSDLQYVTTPAEAYFDEALDGLAQEWDGMVWCNPPYSTPEPWALKCVDHGNGLLLTHMPMNAEWCSVVWQSCDGIRLFQAMEFLRPDGQKQRPGYWLQLAAFGDVATDALARMVVPNDVAENPRRVPSPMWVPHA